MRLYQIAHEYEEILNSLYDDDGVINEQALARLEQNEILAQQKFIAIASFIKNMDAEREAIDAAKKAMAEREKRCKKRIEELENYLLTNMERRQINHIKCPYFDIKLKKNPPSVEVFDEKLLPEKYLRVKTETSPDKIKIKEELMAGFVVPGANIKVSTRLDIK